MNNNIEKLINKFKEIKNKELIASLRGGSTGIGYTFETLLGKKEDTNYLPDYYGIEIKTKLGYTKVPITLFTLTPNSSKESTVEYILENFGYYTSKNKVYKSLRADAFYHNIAITGNRYIFKLKIEDEILRLYILNTRFELISKEIYWDFNDIYLRLVTKLQLLAIVKGYPYKVEGQTFYKYTNINIYKLINKKYIKNLIENDYVYITFNIDRFTTEEKKGKIHDRGTAFKIKQEYIEKLFKKIY